MVNFTFKEIDYLDFANDVRQAVCLCNFDLSKQTANGAKIILINEYPELKKIKERYTFLGNHALFLETPPLDYSPIHVDGMVRKFVINIMISDTSAETKVCFYDPTTVRINTTHSDASESYYDKVSSNVKPIAEYTLSSNPIVVHTMIPHQIDNAKGTKARISFSWVLDCDDYSQEAIEKVVENIEKISKSC